MAKVTLRPEEVEQMRQGENTYLDAMVRRFKKQVQQEMILEECKRREFFLKKSLKRREKSKRAKIARIKEMKKLSKKSY